jgi:hypothetical protein
MQQTRHVLVRGLVSLILLVTLAGCDGDGDPVVVDFEVSCASVVCLNVDETSSFISEEGTEFITCIWLCANFRAFEDHFVQLTFERPVGECFALGGEFIADGIC